jgi:hypothetical protein
VGARVIETERGWRRWKEDAEEIIGSNLLAENESDFIIPFFLCSEINLRLKIIPGNLEILIKSRKYSESSEKFRKITRDDLGCEEPK